LWLPKEYRHGANIARKVAHEIKNPLMPIQVSLESMLRFKDDPEKFNKIFEDNSKAILEEVSKIKRIVE